MNKMIIKEALSKEELEQVFAIRKEVFVHEQKMFTETDRDEYDDIAHYLICLVNGNVVGTVRVFPKGEDNCWVGGRLAVKKEYRGTRAGILLVKEAVKLVKKKQCTRFSATIQKQNVHFFERLGWKATSPIFYYKGHPHVIMEADLDSDR